MTSQADSMVESISKLSNVTMSKPFIVYWYQPVVDATGRTLRQFMKVLDMVSTEKEAVARSNELSSKLGVDVIFFDQSHDILLFSPEIYKRDGGNVIVLESATETTPSSEGSQRSGNEQDITQEGDLLSEKATPVIPDIPKAEDIKMLKPLEMFLSLKMSQYVYVGLMKKYSENMKVASNKVDELNILQQKILEEYPDIEHEWKENLEENIIKMTGSSKTYHDFKKVMDENEGM